MKRTEQEQRVKVLTECIKHLEKMKSTKDGVIVITDGFIGTSMADEEGKSHKEIFQSRLSHNLNLITDYLVHVAEQANIPLTNILLPLLIEVAKEEGIEVGQFSKEELEALREREQILN